MFCTLHPLAEAEAERGQRLVHGHSSQARADPDSSPVRCPASFPSITLSQADCPRSLRPVSPALIRPASSSSSSARLTGVCIIIKLRQPFAELGESCMGVVLEVVILQGLELPVDAEEEVLSIHTHSWRRNSLRKTFSHQCPSVSPLTRSVQLFYYPHCFPFSRSPVPTHRE